MILRLNEDSYKLNIGCSTLSPLDLFKNLSKEGKRHTSRGVIRKTSDSSYERLKLDTY